MNRTIWIGIAALILIAGGWWYFTQPNTSIPWIGQQNTEATTKINPQLSASPTSGNAPLGISFSANKQGLSRTGNYTLDFGDGTKTTTDDFKCGLQFCSQEHTYTAAGSYTAKYTGASGKIAAAFSITVSAPASVSATINSTANTLAPTISGTLQNMNGKGDLSIVIVKSGQSLPAQSANPAQLTNIAAYATSGTDGDINTDYKTQYSYTSPTLSPGTYIVGLYLNTLFVQDASFKGFQLLASNTLVVQ